MSFCLATAAALGLISSNRSKSTQRVPYLEMPCSACCTKHQSHDWCFPLWLVAAAIAFLAAASHRVSMIKFEQVQVHPVALQLILSVSVHLPRSGFSFWTLCLPQKRGEKKAFVLCCTPWKYSCLSLGICSGNLSTYQLLGRRVAVLVHID